MTAPIVGAARTLLHRPHGALPPLPPGDDVAASRRPDAVRRLDTDPGMSREDRDRAVAPSFGTKGQGTGLGLGLAYGSASQSSGAVSIEGWPGTGVRLAALRRAVVGAGPA